MAALNDARVVRSETQIELNYICPYCKNPLHDPVQVITCGDRFCRSCITQLESGNGNYKCSVDETKFDSSEIRTDKGCQKDIQRLVECHSGVCVPENYHRTCKAAVLCVQHDVVSLDTQPHEYEPNSFSAKVQNISDRAEVLGDKLTCHQQENIGQPPVEDIFAEKTTENNITARDTGDQGSLVVGNMAANKSKLLHGKKSASDEKEGGGGGGGGSSDSLMEQSPPTGYSQTHYVFQARSLSHRQAIEQTVHNMKENMDSHQLQLSNFSEIVSSLQQSVTQQANAIDELKLRQDILDVKTTNGELIWKIPDLRRRYRDALDGRTISLYSPPFYTNPHGYRMCIRTYLNGDGIGKGTHISMFFVLMRSEFDTILHWPFRHSIQFSLINQKHPPRNIIKTLKPDFTSPSYQKPQSDMNIASGFPKFAGQSVLQDQDFIIDDTIYIKCHVDCSNQAL